MGITDTFINLFSQVTSGIDDLYVPGEDLEHDIVQMSVRVVTISAVTLIILTLIAAVIKDHAEKLKMPLFVMMSITMAGSFLWLAGSTVYLNVNSDSGGPVHWHADIEYWACDNQLELRDPTGTLSNKIGTSVLHEHDDQRIHLEGVVVDGVKDASLGKFMYVIDGAITDNALVMPLNEDVATRFEDDVDGDGPNDSAPNNITDLIVMDRGEYFLRAVDGQECGDGTIGDVQVFVYNYNSENKTYTQTKLDRPQDYIITDDPNVPPGDCIIFEFSEPKPYTDKLCEQYGVRDIEKCEAFGVEPSKREICENTDVTDYDALDAAFSEQSVSNDADDDVDVSPDPDDDTFSTSALDEACSVFFDEDGTFNGIEIAVQYPGDPSRIVDATTDCDDYVDRTFGDSEDEEGVDIQ